MNQISTDANVDEIVATQIETQKMRVHILSQELWDCKDYPNRVNLLIMLSAAVSELLLLETNQRARKDNSPNR